MSLITAQEVKTNTSIGGNVDADKFIHLIFDIQIMVLENVLGTKLYDKIVTDFNEGSTNNLAGDYLTMFNDYIKPVLWHSVYAEYLRDGIILAQNGGIVEHQQTDSVTANLDNILYVAKGAQSTADVYIDRLNKFLCTKNSDIPEYSQTQDNEYDQTPDSNLSTIGGWFFGNDDYSPNNSASGVGGNYLELE